MVARFTALGCRLRVGPTRASSHDMTNLFDRRFDDDSLADPEPEPDADALDTIADEVDEVMETVRVRPHLRRRR